MSFEFWIWLIFGLGLILTAVVAYGLAKVLVMDFDDYVESKVEQMFLEHEEYKKTKKRFI